MFASAVSIIIVVASVVVVSSVVVVASVVVVPSVVIGQIAYEDLDAVEVVVDVLVGVQVLYRAPRLTEVTNELSIVLLGVVGILVIALYLTVKMTRLAVETVERFESAGFPVVVRIFFGNLMHVVRRLFELVRQFLHPVGLSEVRMACLGRGSES